MYAIETLSQKVSSASPIPLCHNQRRLGRRNDRIHLKVQTTSKQGEASVFRRDNGVPPLISLRTARSARLILSERNHSFKLLVRGSRKLVRTSRPYLPFQSHFLIERTKFLALQAPCPCISPGIYLAFLTFRLVPKGSGFCA